MLDDEVSSEEDIEPFYPPDDHSETAGIEHNKIHHSVQSDSHLRLSSEPGSFGQQEPLEDFESSHLSEEEDVLSDKDPDAYESDHLNDESIEEIPSNNNEHESSQTTHDVISPYFTQEVRKPTETITTTTRHEGSQTTHDNNNDVHNEPEVFPSTATLDVTLDTVRRSSSDNIQDQLIRGTNYRNIKTRAQVGP